MNIFKSDWVIRKPITEKELEILIITIASCGFDTKWVNHESVKQGYLYVARTDFDGFHMVNRFLGGEIFVTYKEVIKQLRNKIKEECSI